MNVTDLLPRLRSIPSPVGHACLWHDPAALTQVDAFPGPRR